MDAGRKKVYILLGVAGFFIGLGIIFSIRNRHKAVKLAESFEGETEITGNAGFNDPAFQDEITQVGWQTGDAWCVFFAKLVWWQAAPDFLKQKILDNITGSTWTTWNNVLNDPSFVISDVPHPGDMVIWRLYQGGIASFDGHAGIVKKLGIGKFTTIEGNIDPSGASNEGYIVAEKTRDIDFGNENGLRILGFVRFA